MRATLDQLVKRERAMAYAQLVIGCFLGALAYPLFLTPNAIAPGGVTGIATILNQLFDLPVGLTSMVMNVPLFIFGYRSMGKIFAFRSLIATVLFSVAIDLIQIKPLTDDVLLGSLYGGILLGIGLGFILRAGATTGGSDMIARMVHKKIPFISVGMFLFGVDFLVIILAGIFLGVQQALYALICIFLTSKVVDMVITGVSSVNACYVITDKVDRVSARIMEEVERGVTLLSAKGGYSKEERPVLMCVASSSEIVRIKAIVRQEDENAFMFITGAHEALGEGFSKLNQDT